MKQKLIFLPLFIASTVSALANLGELTLSPTPMNFHIEILETALSDFDISAADYNPEMNNVQTTSIIPTFEQGESSREQLVEIQLAFRTFNNDRICSINTTSRFKVTCDQEFDLRQDFNKPKVIEVFSQIILLSNGHLQGMLKENTKDNADFVSMNFSTHFLEELQTQAYSILTALNKMK